ncbi:MAG: hypothetical protein CMH56_12070 [Myxococcales bacterium]|nr:hypothetical protein [Myxococcales bacterium]|tara:strand:- start:4566 stop:5000 length:435 start_codon:yes stop_codon:yes gene_type:complete
MLCRPLSIFEVNALLPLVQDRMEELHLYWDQAQIIRKQMLKQVSAEPGLGTQPQKVPSSVLEAELAEIEALITEKLLHLQRYGAFVREIFPGVVEFYSTRAGAPVLLNWHFGEEEVSQWLSLDGEMSEPSEIVDQSLFGDPILH